MSKQAEAVEKQVAGMAVISHLLGQRIDQSPELTEEQVFFISIMGVEGGSTHVCPVDDVLHGDGVVALDKDQLKERIPQQLMGAPHAAIIGSRVHLHSHIFSTLPAICPLPDIGARLVVDRHCLILYTELSSAKKELIKMRQHMHTSENAPETKGRVIHWAGLYDILVGSLTFGLSSAMREMTVTLALIQPGEKILDVGCGTGDLSIAARKRAGPTAQVFGIDAAPEMVNVARRKAARMGMEVDFRVGLVEALDFPAGSFDVVLSSLMMHHLPDDLKVLALAEIRRVLKPGGRLLVLDFKRPTNLAQHISTAIHGHTSMQTGSQDLPTLMTHAGFTGIETGNTQYGFLGYVRCRAA